MVRHLVRNILSLMALTLLTLSFAHGAPRDAFIELSADKAEVYLQEQLVLTVRLFFSGNLVRGELSEPEHPDAVIESLGKQKDYTRFRDGIRYRVVERRYAVFPQKTGTLVLPPIRFDGQTVASDGTLQRLRREQQLYEVPVNDIPEVYPENQPWLPSSALTLTQEGLPDSALDVGSNLSVKTTLEAEGLTAQALPGVRRTYPDTLKQYPEQPLKHTRSTPEGLQASLQQSTALVPLKPGEATIPAFRLAWWNTNTDQLEYATLPTRTLLVTGQSTTTGQTSPPTDTEASEPSSGNAESRDPVWFRATVILALLWLATLAAWWLSRRVSTRTQPQAQQAAGTSEKHAFEQLIEAIEAGSEETSGLLLRWARQRFPDLRVGTREDLVRSLEAWDLERLLRRYEQCLFSAGGSSPGPALKKQLTATLKDLRNTKKGRGSQADPLAPLYPEGLSD